MTVDITFSNASAAEALAEMRVFTGAAASGSGGGTTTPPPVVTPPPVDANVYPFQMPAGITDRAPITLGTGSDSIEINVASNPSGTILNQYSVIVVQGAARKGIVDTFTATSKGGASVSDAQNVTLRGTWPGLSSIMISSAGVGLSGIWVNSLAVNLIPWVSDGDAVNSRGSGNPSYGTQIFDSNGANMVWYPPNSVALPPPAPPAPPAPPLTLIDGKTLAELLVPPVTLPAGTIVGTGAINTAGTVAGAGMGKTIIDVTNLRPFQDKGALVFNVPGIVLQDLTIKGASVAAALGANAGGVRDNGPGIGGTLQRVEITGCNNGIMTAGGPWVIEDSNLHGNGTDGDKGHVHEAYIGGGPGSTCTVRRTNMACGVGSTHALKSRAETTEATDSNFVGNPDPTGAVGGSVIDVPDGGNFTMTGGSITLSAGAANTLFLSHAVESDDNATTGVQVKLSNVVLNDLTGTGGILQGGAGSVLILENVTYTGLVVPDIRGFVVTGKINPA